MYFFDFINPFFQIWTVVSNWHSIMRQLISSNYYGRVAPYSRASSPFYDLRRPNHELQVVTYRIQYLNVFYYLFFEMLVGERIAMGYPSWKMLIYGSDDGDRLARFSTATPLLDVNKGKTVYKMVTLLIKMFKKLSPSEI